MAFTFTYTGSEALEMVKTHYPKTWENEINDGRIFIKSLMKMYNLDSLEAYKKYLKTCGSCEKAVSTLAALHLMNLQVKIGRELAENREKQEQCINQAQALEESRAIEEKDKKMLRKFYADSKTKIQAKINELINSYPVIGAEIVVVQTNIFD